MAITDTPWGGGSANKFFLQSGTFSSLLKDSLPSGVGIKAIEYDLIDTLWGSYGNTLYRQSGQFTSTVKDSQPVSRIEGASYDNVNTLYCDLVSDKLFLLSGSITGFVKTSNSAPKSAPQGISADGLNGNTLNVDSDFDRLYVVSGQFTSIIKSSLYINNPEKQPTDISYNGVNTPWCGSNGQKMYLQAGQFGAMLTSQSTAAWEFSIQGIGVNDFNSRMGIIIEPEIDVSPTTLAFGDVVVSNTSDETVTISNTGTGDLIVSGLTVDSNLYSIISPTSVPFTVSLSGSTVATLRFAPEVVGTQSGIFTITSDDNDEPTVAVSLSATGIIPESPIYFNLYIDQARGVTSYIDQSVNFDLEL